MAFGYIWGYIWYIRRTVVNTHFFLNIPFINKYNIYYAQHNYVSIWLLVSARQSGCHQTYIIVQNCVLQDCILNTYWLKRNGDLLLTYLITYLITYLLTYSSAVRPSKSLGLLNYRRSFFPIDYLKSPLLILHLKAIPLLVHICEIKPWRRNLNDDIRFHQVRVTIRSDVWRRSATHC